MKTKLMKKATRALMLAVMAVTVSAVISSCGDDVIKAGEPVAPVKIVDVTKGAQVTLSTTGSETLTVSGVENGIYDVEFYYRCDGEQTAAYVESEGKMTAMSEHATEWSRSVVRGVTVSGGTCSVTITQVGDGKVTVGNVKLVEADGTFDLIKGGDISMLTLVEDNGGKYFLDGKEMDCVELLKSQGVNMVRLRLYNDPGNPDYSPSNRLPAGYQDEADILNLAKRAKAAGMDIELTFHYSDSWTNGTAQYKPHAWANLSFDDMCDAVFSFTSDFLKKMNAQGTPARYISLGNETQAGLLYDEDSENGRLDFGELAKIYSAGAAACRNEMPDAKIIIHLSGGGDVDMFKWYFVDLINRKVDFDILGASYYPYWTNKTIEQIGTWATKVGDMFDKDILLMEVGYAWYPTLPDGSVAQLSNNGPYREMTPRAQRNFMNQLTQEIKRNKRILGYIYWDPIFIPAGSAGWELGAKNVVSNATLFDFGGNAQEVMNAFKYNN